MAELMSKRAKLATDLTLILLSVFILTVLIFPSLLGIISTTRPFSELYTPTRTKIHLKKFKLIFPHVPFWDSPGFKNFFKPTNFKKQPNPSILWKVTDFYPENLPVCDDKRVKNKIANSPFSKAATKVNANKICLQLIILSNLNWEDFFAQLHSMI